MMLFRKKDWELIDKTILPCVEECRAKSARAAGRHYNGDHQVDLFGLELTFKPSADHLVETVVLTFKCRNTKKIKVKVVKTHVTSSRWYKYE